MGRLTPLETLSRLADVLKMSNGLYVNGTGSHVSETLSGEQFSVSEMKNHTLSNQLLQL